MFKAMWNMLWRRDTESAACLCIVVSERMSDKDLRDIAEYFKALLDNRQSGVSHE